MTPDLVNQAAHSDRNNAAQVCFPRRCTSFRQVGNFYSTYTYTYMQYIYIYICIYVWRVHFVVLNLSEHENFTSPLFIISVKVCLYNRDDINQQFIRIHSTIKKITELLKWDKTKRSYQARKLTWKVVNTRIPSGIRMRDDYAGAHG